MNRTRPTVIGNLDASLLTSRRLWSVRRRADTSAGEQQGGGEVDGERKQASGGGERVARVGKRRLGGE